MYIYIKNPKKKKKNTIKAILVSSEPTQHIEKLFKCKHSKFCTHTLLILIATNTHTRTHNYIATVYAISIYYNIIYGL